MQTIAELLGKHPHEEAWIFGKGPSLDRFDFATAGPLRICINESVLTVPGATYFFAHDELPIQRAAAAWPMRLSCHLAAGSSQLRGNKRHSGRLRFLPTQNVSVNLELLDWSPEKIAQKSSLLGLTGTVHSAIHFCRLIGVSSVVFVGMDGTGGYAQCIGTPPPPGGGQHDVIRRDSITIAKRLGLAFRFADAT